MIVVNNEKNRARDPYTFANINLLGKCNCDCFFCLGKDIAELLNKHDQTQTHYSEWHRFSDFLSYCKIQNIAKIYITGQNTDSLLYKYLGALIEHLQSQGFGVGLRTNGYLATEKMSIINTCDLSAGFSIHTLNTVTNKMILGRKQLPDWDKILPATERPRVSIVLNRCNEYEFFPLLRYLQRFPNIRYVQVRRVSTDTRLDLLTPDIVAYERLYSKVREIFPMTGKLWTDAEVYDIYGMSVVFWRTIKTSVNSMNYFTDGTVSDMYFVVEGYLKYCKE